jgi:aspartyl-tRNA(Asn)/glutamyl-tRNA(Gln) amidotransferase subunit B
MAAYGLTPDEAAAMSAERDLSELFEAVAQNGVMPRKVAGWITAQLAPILRERNLTVNRTCLTAERFAALLTALEKERITPQAAREVLAQLLDSNAAFDEIVEKGRFCQLSDTAELAALIEQVLAAHPSDVQDFRNGNAKVQGFLMGQAMKASQGKANPKRLKELLAQRLG